MIIFVSVLHDEFSLPLVGQMSRGQSGGSGGLGLPPGSPGGAAGSSSWAVSSWQSAAFFSPNQSQPGNRVPSFRYGWSFYAALAAFICSEMAAALYVILHTHIFKKRTALLRRHNQPDSSAATKSAAPSREVAVQTSTPPTPPQLLPPPPANTSLVLIVPDGRPAGHNIQQVLF